ncbi:DUF3857 domain-containing protein [Dokdonella sp. MW10]|uniref:DUF3857 domain-containing protein n=1 Tax=Dokdonella sp. MW10 TaxID=2992926 RepID=UPI003F7CEF51
MAWSGFAVVAFGAAADARGDTQGFSTGPAPGWVVPVEPGRADAAMLAAISRGNAYLLVDTQVRSVPAQRSTYQRFAMQAVAPEGIDAVANIEMDFDPSYQTIVVHAIDVVRDGNRTSRLATADFKILQRETALERRIYDGGRTVSVFLEDVRVGDVVDYAFSVVGRNPVFAGRDYGTFMFQYGVPVARLHVHLLEARGSGIVVGARNAVPEAVEGVRDGLRSRRWSIDAVPARLADADEPGWFHPEPMLQWGAFADWSDVARWAVPLYAVPKDVAPSVAAEIARIAAAEPTESGRLLAALRFVQGEIRYLGIAIGAHSHAPSSPARTLERRFGDCKDKTLLMLALLDGLGVEARAALVDTRLRRGLGDRFASPGQFDHVLVRAVVDGRVYWLDPTKALQRADLAHVVQADFDLALTIDPGTRGLESMRSPHAPAPRKTVRVTIDATEGLDLPVTYTVVTEAEGASAEQLRAEFATSSVEEIGKRYLNFYASYHPGMSIVAPVAIEDDAPSNRVTVTERYRVEDFAEEGNEEGRRVASIWMPDMAPLLRAPASAVRDAPLRIAHPTDLTVVTRVLLDGDWSIKDETDEVEGDAFTYRREIAYAQRVLMITSTFRSRVDEIAAAATSRHAGQLSRARDRTGYELSWRPQSHAVAQGGFVDRVNWTLAGFGIMVLIGSIAVAVRLYRYDPPATPVAPGAPEGFAGWLVLPTIGVCLAPLRMAFDCWKELGALSAEHWSSLTTFGSESYHALWAPFLMFSAAGSIALLVLWSLILVLYLQKRTSTPRIYIAAMLSAIVMNGVLFSIMPLLPGVEIERSEWTAAIRNVVSAVIWTSYFLVSVRVRATFTRRLGGQRPATHPPVLQATAPVLS